MSGNRILTILALCLFAGILVAGCTQQPAAIQKPTPAPATTPASVTTAPPAGAGVANPASVNCGTLGGTTEIKKNADSSEYGMCTFSNGTSCEEWALFRNEGCRAGGK
jgi:putative hemolysin